MPVAGKTDIDLIPPHVPQLFPAVFAETYRLVPFRLADHNLAVLGAQASRKCHST